MATLTNKAGARSSWAALAVIGLMVLAIGHLAAPAAHATHETGPEQWTIGPNDTYLYSHTPYRIFSMGADRPVMYERDYSDSYDLDLGFEGTVPLEWEIGRSWECGKRHCTISYGRRIALYNSRADRYLKWGPSGCFGGLEWSSTPVYEWSIRRRDGWGNSMWGPVHANWSMALFNHYWGGYLAAWNMGPTDCRMFRWTDYAMVWG